MNILIFNHYQTSFTYSASSRFAAIATEWQRQGHRVTLVSASYSHIYNEQPKVHGLFGVHEVEGVRFVLLRTPGFRDNGWGRTWNMLAFVALACLFVPWWAFRPRPDLVIASSVYLLDSIPAWAISRLAGAWFIREFRDLWPMTLIELGALPADSLKARILQGLEAFSIRTADHFVSTLPFAMDYLAPRGVTPDRFTYLPLAMTPLVPPPVPSEIPPAMLARILAHKAGFRLLVAFTGSMGNGDTVDTLLAAAREVAPDGIGFLLVGDGVNRTSYEAQIQAEGITNVLILPRTPRRVCCALQGLADALYIGWEAKPLYRFGLSPNRMMDYMQAGRPIVHALAYGNDPVREAGCGLSVPAGDPSALAAAFRTLAAMPSEDRLRMGQAAKAYLVANHDPALLAARYLNKAVPSRETLHGLS